MRFERELDGYLTYLKANRGLSENTRSAYARDVRSCLEAMQRRGVAELGEITLDDLRMWMAGSPAPTRVRAWPAGWWRCGGSSSGPMNTG